MSDTRKTVNRGRSSRRSPARAPCQGRVQPAAISSMRPAGTRCWRERRHGFAAGQSAQARPPAVRSSPASSMSTTASGPRADRRGAHPRRALDARADAGSRLQPLLGERLGPDQRESQDPDREPAARDQGVSLAPQGKVSYDNGDAAPSRTCPSPTAPTTAAISTSTTRPTRGWRGSACDVMKCDKIIEIPNAARHPRACGRRSSRGRATSSPTASTRHSDPQRRHDPGRALDLSLRSSPRSTARPWRSPGRSSSTATSTTATADYQGKYAFSTSYNGEDGRESGGDDRQRAAITWRLSSTSSAIEEGVAAGDFTEMNGVPVLERPARARSSPAYIPISNSPARHATRRPTSKPRRDQRQALADGLDDRRHQGARCVLRVGKIEPRSAIVGEPELGLGPLHTAFDGKGNCLHHAVPRQPGGEVEHRDLAIRQFSGEEVDPIIWTRSMSSTSRATTRLLHGRDQADADGKWLVSLNKFSKDRFINVGPLKPENEQLIDISGDKMTVVHDGPTFAEPHDSHHRAPLQGQSERLRLGAQRPDLGGGAAAGRRSRRRRSRRGCAGT